MAKYFGSKEYGSEHFFGSTVKFQQCVWTSLGRTCSGATYSPSGLKFKIPIHSRRNPLNMDAALSLPGSNQDQSMRRFKKGHNSDTFTLKRSNLPHHPVAIPARPACPAAAARFLVAVTHSERRRLPFRSPRWVWADFRTERQRVTWHSEMGKLYLLCFV